MTIEQRLLIMNKCEEITKELRGHAESLDGLAATLHSLGQKLTGFAEDTKQAAAQERQIATVFTEIKKHISEVED